MPQAIIAVEALLPRQSLRRSLTRGAALQYELGLVLQHQYSLVPIVPLNCVRPSAVRGVRVYQTSDMRGLFHRTRRGRNRHVDASTLPQMASLSERWLLTTANESPACCRQLGKLQTTS